MAGQGGALKDRGFGVGQAVRESATVWFGSVVKNPLWRSSRAARGGPGRVLCGEAIAAHDVAAGGLGGQADRDSPYRCPLSRGAPHGWTLASPRFAHGLAAAPRCELGIAS